MKNRLIALLVLFTVTKYKGYDPEVDSNIQLGNYPNTKQYSFGVELTF